MVELSAIVQVASGAAAGVGLSLTDGWQALVGDRIAHWRLTNAMKLQPKIAAELRAAGLALKDVNIPDRYAFTWFEEATKQDEDEIQNLFAKLLVQVAAGNAEATDRRLLDIVTRFTPNDARIFKSIYESADWRVLRRLPTKQQHWRFSRLHSIANKSAGPDGTRTVEHLVTLGVIGLAYEINSRALGGQISTAYSAGRLPDIPKIEIDEQATSTALGMALFLALYPDHDGADHS